MLGSFSSFGLDKTEWMLDFLNVYGATSDLDFSEFGFLYSFGSKFSVVPP
jgi:hypothetical protein